MARWKYHPNIPPEIPVPDKSIFEIFQDTVENHGEKPFLYFQGAQMSYNEAYEKVIRFANSLKELNCKKGDRIAILMPNCPQFVISYISSLSLGCIVTCISPLYAPQEIKYQLDDSGAKVLITLDNFLDNVFQIIDETPVENLIVSSIADELNPLKGLFYRLFIGRKYPSKRPKDLSYKSLIKNGQKIVPKADIDPREDLACLQYTGGTTGVPKGVMLTHRNLVSQMVVLDYWEEWIGGPIPGVQGRSIGALPFDHIFGLSTSFLWPLYAGQQIFLIPDPRKLEELMQTISKYDVHFFNAVPTLFQKLAESPKIENYDLSSLRLCISGGSALHPNTQELFEEKTGALLIEGYGLSEASPVTHVNPADKNIRQRDIGIPIPNTNAKIVSIHTNEDITSFEDNGKTKKGELCVKGEQVMKGYWNKPEATAKVLTEDGWLKTGDVAQMDEGGFFNIVDRLKDVIFTSGFQVWPLEVEKALCKHPDILMAAVIPVEDKEGNERVKAILVPAKGAEKHSLEEIRAFCKKYLAPYKVPRYIEYREELPLSPVGKILRRPLREEACLEVQKEKIRK
ncbi:MAG: long-chain fatty acid--CoA ligase [Asgard group archaeon]|nr:long-chain fatty acid--CoA ligase [Asgard group archaeon]